MYFRQTAFTHDDPRRLKSIDGEIANFVRLWMNSAEVRNNTLIIIGSDHGHHYIPSSIHSHYIAQKLDHFNPMMYMLVPPWMKAKYPERIRALLTNSKTRVTTNIDLYLTLTHLLNFTQPDLRSKHGQTLFTVIPKNRTCEDMGIPQIYCGCDNIVQVDVR
jgi:membrane-anchored protein YejM (alkaline phosphatase superfamily)